MTMKKVSKAIIAIALAISSNSYGQSQDVYLISNSAKYEKAMSEVLKEEIKTQRNLVSSIKLEIEKARFTRNIQGLTTLAATLGTLGYGVYLGNKAARIESLLGERTPLLALRDPSPEDMRRIAELDVALAKAGYKVIGINAEGDSFRVLNGRVDLEKKFDQALKAIALAPSIGIFLMTVTSGELTELETKLTKLQRKLNSIEQALMAIELTSEEQMVTPGNSLLVPAR